MWPLVELKDIVLYLSQTPGQYTREKLKAYKSLDAYNYFVSGWVDTCCYREINKEFCVLIAAERLSQDLSEKPHRPWVCVRQNDGSVSVRLLHGRVSCLCAH